MPDIGIRELNQQTSRVLRRVVSTGESVTVTDHGRRVAMIVPIPDTRYQTMLDSGHIRPGSRELSQVNRKRLSRPSAATLDELREDRL